MRSESRRPEPQPKRREGGQDVLREISRDACRLEIRGKAIAACDVDHHALTSALSSLQAGNCQLAEPRPRFRNSIPAT